MIYIKWLFLALIDWILFPVWFIASPVVSLFTTKGWGKLAFFGTYDNPPQGDRGFIADRAPYRPASNPWQLYVNRVFWLWRNPGYGFQRWASVGFGNGLAIKHVGNEHISDKYKIAGWYFARCFDIDGNVIAFELYAVLPWSDRKCLRVRLGWKIMTSKFLSLGFAPLVNTINPVKSYGE